MATLTSIRGALNAPVPGLGLGGNLLVSWGSYTLAANPTQNDVIRFCKVPANSRVLCGFVQGADIDTGTEAFDFDLGWLANGVEAADTDGFGNFGVVTGDAITELKPETGIFLPFGGVLFTTGPQKFSAETVIAGLVNAAANSGGTGIITVMAFFVIDP